MKKNKTKRSVAFTKKQFVSLMKVVYLGNWMANAYRTTDIKKEYQDIENYIFSFAPQFGLERYMDHEDTDGKRYYPTSYFEESTDVHVLHEAYDEETFWDELAERLGEKDFFEKYSKEEIKKMTREEWFTKRGECVDKWNEEFYEYGIERVSLVSNSSIHK